MTESFDYFPPQTRQLALELTTSQKEPGEILQLLHASLVAELQSVEGIGANKARQLIVSASPGGGRYFAHVIVGVRNSSLWSDYHALYKSWRDAVNGIESDPGQLLALTAPMSQQRHWFVGKAQPQKPAFRKSDIIHLREWLARWR